MFVNQNQKLVFISKPNSKPNSNVFWPSRVMQQMNITRFQLSLNHSTVDAPHFYLMFHVFLKILLELIYFKYNLMLVITLKVILQNFQEIFLMFPGVSDSRLSRFTCLSHQWLKAAVRQGTSLEQPTPTHICHYFISLLQCDHVSAISVCMSRGTTLRQVIRGLSCLVVRSSE